MKTRCYNTRAKNYPDYGGRGITMCDEWRNDFAAFFRDIGPRPSPKHSIDRINNDGPYAPENVRWAVRSVQNRNRRTNRYIVLNGQRVLLVEAAKRFGVKYHTALARLRNGCSPEEIVRA